MTNPLRPRRPARLIPLLLVSVGLAVLGAFTLWPLLQVWLARNWMSVPCEILSSAVSTSRGKSTTYGIAIAYRYRAWDGRHIGHRYNFVGGFSSGRASKQAIVDRLPPGQHTVCFVNPRQPNEAVLNREASGAITFGLFGLLLIGAGFFYRLPRTLRVTFSSTVQPAAVVPEPTKELSSAKPHALQPHDNVWTTLKTLGLLAAVWNGITFTIGFLTLRSMSSQEIPALAIFGIFFVLGLLIASLAIYRLLSFFNPKVQLHARSLEVSLGAPLTVSWRIIGPREKLAALSIELIGTQKATLVTGSGNRASHSRKSSVFTQLSFLETTDRTRMDGEATVIIPGDSMHTFTALRNAVSWELSVHGTIPGWPDVQDQYPVTVLPHSISSAQQ